jgi:hypothetical protein
MNLTIVALSAVHLSRAPFFAGKPSLTLSRCGFSRYFSPIFFNSYGLVSRTTFRQGLSAAIYVSKANQGYPEEYIDKNGTIKLSLVNIRSEAVPERCAVYINSSSADVTINRCGVETWNPPTGAPIQIFAASLRVEGLCIFNSRGGDTGALEVSVSAAADIAVMTAAAGPDFGNGSLSLYKQTVLVSGEYFRISYSNVTLYKQTDGPGVSGFDTNDWSGGSLMEYVLVQNCSSAWAIRFASAGLNASRIENLNIVHTEARAALMTFNGPCRVSTSYFMGNTGAGAEHFTAVRIGGSVTFIDCITDQKFSAGSESILFRSCSESAETKTVAFVALNTLQCVGQASSFFQNFTTEEIIANIICAFGLIVALIETVVYFVKEGLCGDKDEEEGDYEEDIENIDEEEDTKPHHHSHRHKA